MARERPRPVLQGLERRQNLRLARLHCHPMLLSLARWSQQVRLAICRNFELIFQCQEYLPLIILGSKRFEVPKVVRPFCFSPLLVL